jgi:hypothetical protein
MATTHQVRAQVLFSLNELDEWLAKQSAARLDPDWSAHFSLARHEIKLALSDQSKLEAVPRTSAPPGSPIGN